MKFNLVRKSAIVLVDIALGSKTAREELVNDTYYTHV